ncbi:hypothetical protein CY34DRAFT_107840 [Suillus luteus UH-Slu-Lm8-n1]|uniref:Uncharacterized protein n=1 Tax=Suillus luteus UH-Slu-Lm8-n1 TaxID=930992 RepID=A0A0D0AF06_9AGAM|nr:hypothetical protein CY34DRAFT_107840 [Suillus luteus UH-Slu-Lm8-n1]
MLAIRNPELVPESLKKAHTQSLTATKMVKLVTCDHSDVTTFKKDTLLMDCDNEDLVPSLWSASLPAEISTSCIEVIDGAGLSLMTIKGDNSENYKTPIYTNQLYAPYVIKWVTLHYIEDSD